MKLDFIKADPAGNTTVFVLTPVPPALRAQAARKIMSPAGVGAEQVGFVSEGRMDMMGGEFCGNASRSYGAYLALRGPDGRTLRGFTGTQRVDVTVSGAREPLPVLVQGLGEDNVCRAAIRMPLPRSVTPLTDPVLGDCTLVCFEGIAHLLLPNREPRESDLAPARALAASLEEEPPCVGLIYTAGETALRPLVFVRETGTLVWESSCASGSCAAAAAYALARGQSCDVDLTQPGGTLSCQVTVEDGAVTALTLGGPVRFTAAGTLFLD